MENGNDVCAQRSGVNAVLPKTSKDTAGETSFLISL